MQRPIEKPVGTPAREIDTPALLVDVDRLDANVAVIRGPARAEAWVHKTPAIARRQVAHADVVGIAVRSIAEAEVFAAAGFDDIRVLRPLVTPRARERATALGKSIRQHLSDKKPVSEICEENDLQPSVFYTWMRQLLANAPATRARSGDHAKMRTCRTCCHHRSRWVPKSPVPPGPGSHVNH